MNTQSWEATFPSDQSTEEKRLRFLIRMCYIAIAHYLLYRQVLPKGVFKRRRVEDVYYYCFDQNTRWGMKLSEMMKGIRHAIEKKYVKQAFIMLNEDAEHPDEATEVFSISFCYKADHAMRVLDDQGNCIVSMGYKGEQLFRTQTKHLIKKINTVTKALKPLSGKPFTPSLKLTYYENTPDQYEPPAFVPCQNTYTFKSKPTFYSYGSIASNESAIAFDLKSVYITENDVAELDDLLFAETGLKEGKVIGSLDVTADGYFTSEEKSEIIEKARQDQYHDHEPLQTPVFTSPQLILDLDEDADDDTYDSPELGKQSKKKKVRGSPYVKIRSLRSCVLTPRIEGTRHAPQLVTKASVTDRAMLKSPTDNTIYKNGQV